MSSKSQKTYKIWSDDLGFPEEDAYVRTSVDWVDDVVSELCEEKYTDWEYPNSPFIFFTCEVDDKGEKIGDVQKISVTVDYSPNFYTSIIK